MEIFTVDDLANKLKQIRIKRDKKTEEIAKKVPISRNGYTHWENGKRTINIFALSRLSKILNFSICIKNGKISIEENEKDTNQSEAISNTRTSSIHINNIDFGPSVDLYTDVDDRPLKKSILKSGLVNPIIVAKINDRYIVVDGNRRLKILKELVGKGYNEYEKVPVVYSSLNSSDDVIKLSIDINSNYKNKM